MAMNPIERLDWAASQLEKTTKVIGYVNNGNAHLSSVDSGYLEQTIEAARTVIAAHSWQPKLPVLRTPDGIVKTADQWKDFARRDDCLDRMVPSDLRVILSNFTSSETGEWVELTRIETASTYTPPRSE